jgi:hypothetical protein
MVELLTIGADAPTFRADFGSLLALITNSFWGVTDDIDSLFEKALGCLQISLLTQSRIDKIAIAIDGPIERAPVPFDVHIGFINVPGLRLFAHVA